LPRRIYNDRMAEPSKNHPRDPLQPTNGAFTILRASEADANLAGEAIVELHGHTLSDRATVVEFLSDSARYLLLAIEGDRVVGSLSGYALQHPHRREPQFLLYGIDVRPEYRSRGIGKALVNRFIVEARAAGAFEVWVLTNESNGAAMAMYAHCGLRRESNGEVMLNLILSDRNSDSA
jgi:ribosomal protein S18 acetylase RimI-like enzyme